MEFWWFYSCFLWFQCAKRQYSDGIYVTKRSPAQEFFSSWYRKAVSGNPQFLTGVNSENRSWHQPCWLSILYICTYLIGGLEHFYDFPFSWECHKPNWRTPWFFRGVEQPTRLHYIYIYIIIHIYIYILIYILQDPRLGFEYTHDISWSEPFANPPVGWWVQGLVYWDPLA